MNDIELQDKPKDALNSVENDETPSEDQQNILEDVVRNTERSSKVEGIVVGTLIKLNEDLVPYVNFSMNPTGRPLSARSTVPLAKEHIGRDVALLFEQNDVRKPIVIGLMHMPKQTVEVEVDGETQEVTAENELLLRCGKSSILLRKDGKIIIKGENILSRARMTNKVKGGSVQLN